jgi:hypothetical protein
MELTGSAHRIAADKITKDRLPTTKYDLYHNVKFLADWPLLVDFYGCQPNLQSDEKPEGTSDERWAQGRTAANLLFQNHLTASVYKNGLDSALSFLTLMKRNFSPMLEQIYLNANKDLTLILLSIQESSTIDFGF